MSREIKFRAHGQVYPKWFYGYYVKNKEGDSFIRSTGNFETYWVLEETLGQFTGMHDKNGVPIFEGDIIKDHIGIGVVEYSEKRASFRVNYGDGLCKWFIDYNLKGELESIEVIGNIHENPEILEKNND